MYLIDIGDGSHLELTAPAPNAVPPAPQESHYRHVAFRVDDVRHAIELVRAAKRPITVEPKDVVLNGRATTIAFFEGPGGEAVEFFHQQ
jgi:catechol 2,3-dioxygenase-like lactoylglutathione lyase family enzyme